MTPEAKIVLSFSVKNWPPCDKKQTGVIKIYNA